MPKPADTSQGMLFESYDAGGRRALRPRTPPPPPPPAVSHCPPHQSNEQRKWVAATVRKAGTAGMTVDELSIEASRQTGREIPPNRISPRCTELKEQKLLVETSRVRKTRCGEWATVLVTPEFSGQNPTPAEAFYGRASAQAQENNQ